ncbi:MAG: ROK family transcriptional regulator [Chloroflexi bacterium]|nr:ROK family transcriptional regulator [Anaerolineaceae bacterium]NMB91066.1 ROK family transcriptional regulator [Chloroflexota bacterium]
MKQLGQNLKNLRENNLAVLLSAIWDSENLSRADLAKVTGLAPSSVTRLTQELQRIGLIIEAGKGESSGGRQPVLITPNPGAGIVISLNLSGSSLLGGAYDSANHLLKHEEIPVTQYGPDAILQYIDHLMDIFLHDPELAQKKLLGIGVSISAAVNVEKGEVSIGYYLRLRNFPLRRILKDKYHVPVYLETDTSVAALAEKNYGAVRKTDDFIYLLISTGIGVGMIKDGEIYQSNTGMSGKHGHIVIDRQGPICTCGKRGCLEAIAGRGAILENAKRIFSEGRDPFVSELIHGDLDQLDLPHIAQAAQMGSQEAKNLIDYVAELIAYAISLYTMILNVPLVVVGGDVALEFGDIFIQSINRQLSKFLRDDENVTILQTRLKKDHFLKAISMFTIQQILGEMYQAPAANHNGPAEK